MPRPKRPGAPEPKKRSRNGCWPCKSRKVKCDEGQPQCSNCRKLGTECDYSMRLSWLDNGASRLSKKRRADDAESDPSTSSTSLAASSPPNQGVFDIREAQYPGAVEFRPREPTAARSAVASVGQASSATVLTSQPAPRFLPPAASLSNTFQAAPAERQFDARAAAQDDAFHRPGGLSTSWDTTGHRTVLYGEASSPGLEGFSQYGTTSAISHPSPTKRSNQGFQPINQGNATQLSFVNLAPPSTTEVLSTRFPSHSRSESNSATSPLTTVSTPGGENESHSSSKISVYASSPSDTRRLSVQSLLTNPQDPSCRNERSYTGPGRSSLRRLTRADTPETAIFYGYDCGEPDKDLGENDDEKAILGYSSANAAGRHGWPSEEAPRDSHPSDLGPGPGPRETRNYYEQQVEVWIPKELEPLPDKLRQNPMNLLYFHHFLNHTARVLVPHDDPHSNPYRTVLPQMAVKHDNLLSLLLAYSASHRARHLRHPEPSLRIADLAQGVISDLSTLVQQAVHDPNTIISAADLAAAIMLASLEIASPAAIGGSIPWHHHLNLAREMMSRMSDSLSHVPPTTQDGRVRAFLWSWFAFLDVLGSLSGGPATLLTPACYTGGPQSPSASFPPAGSDTWDEDMERIDCILGFTPRCVYILARIAQLARHCESLRSADPGWTADPAVQSAAAALETAALRSLAAPSRPCGHVHAPAPLRRWDRTQMAAANRAFHHAALIHLHRRVLGKPSGHPDVRSAAQSILECLEHVERGSSAETCLCFPMFTAGCELTDAEDREVVMQRLEGVERIGMTQVRRAKHLLKQVWETGVPWEKLVGNEFIG